MDWSSVTFDWNRVRAFLVTAEEGSLSAAARALGLAQPTLSRQVDALQAELGVVLFERFGRGLELTPAGTALIMHARKMGDAAMSLSIAAYGQSDDLAGPVTIAASDVYAGLLLPPILKQLRAQEPQISIRVLADNQAADLMRREADIAIRNFRPKEPDLIAKRLKDAGANFFATKDYLAVHGPVENESDWSKVDIIAPDRAETFVATMQSLGVPMEAGSVTLECANYLAMWQMVRQGLGVGVIDTQIGDADSSVARVAPSQPDIPFPIWLTAHRDILTNRRMRLVFDFLADALI
ncbi:LysR family transcriptional regulator [Marivita sp. XM-24bin2]|jgi:DNA-binding transcriptional LysR family regulator|uniref:LysR family transcriptional regulator n=1 Tax=unclassified Marivita TaxID=2632480 RepID=UPI0025C23FD6|nr:LysR family transcriptional regulator [Marivita sp. XM-24bin2]MCR9109760.1 LysR family transcriptional regulator [Paracoccaceae bacterium]